MIEIKTEIEDFINTGNFPAFEQFIDNKLSNKDRLIKINIINIVLELIENNNYLQYSYNIFSRLKNELINKN